MWKQNAETSLLSRSYHQRRNLRTFLSSRALHTYFHSGHWWRSPPPLCYDYDIRTRFSLEPANLSIDLSPESPVLAASLFVLNSNFPSTIISFWKPFQLLQSHYSYVKLLHLVTWQDVLPTSTEMRMIALPSNLKMLLSMGQDNPLMFVTSLPPPPSSQVIMGNYAAEIQLCIRDRQI